MKMPQVVMPLRTYRYCLQPGDAVKYQFTLTRLPLGMAGEQVLYDPHNGERDDPQDAAVTDAVTGVESGDYVTVGILMPVSQGSYEIARNNLRSPQSHTVQHMVAKMTGSYPYTVAAVVLAASVLIDQPLNLVKACRRMRPENVQRLLNDEPFLD